MGDGGLPGDGGCWSGDGRLRRRGDLTKPAPPRRMVTDRTTPPRRASTQLLEVLEQPREVDRERGGTRSTSFVGVERAGQCAEIDVVESFPA